MNEKVFRIVEFNKIIDRLAETATSEPGRKRCMALEPLHTLYDIEKAQAETETAVNYLLRKGSISFGSNRDFSGTFKALAIGSALTSGELLRLASFLENAGRARSYGVFEKDPPAANALEDLFQCLYPLKQVSSRIMHCIPAEDEITDDASPELKRIRKNMLLTNDRIHSQLTKMVNSTYSTYLQDNVITLRDNRYCLPVRSECKAQVPGIVHDTSASGSTFFIEPASVVELNNTLRTLAIEEKKEIEKILAELSALTGEHLAELRDNHLNMTTLDFVFAKASLALEQGASRPVFNDRHYINIRKGRHPLIDRQKVVPIDLSIGNDYRMIIITGPNTGGKTVTLKTVGLFELMGMSGLHIPASDHSELSLFREIWADIGDEQSIEQSLSTFSSHMTTIVDIFRHVDRDCLCLFDELGAGTDPTEGAALAISILNFLHTRGITSLATTHYSEMKVYAMNTPGVVNASCEFNVETLQPTYRLMIGVPGKSNAFAISRRLGLPNYIIETAKEQLSQETKNFEELLSDLEISRREAAREREEAAALRERIRNQQAALEKKEEQIRERREEILRKANEEARNILQAAKETADKAISDLRKKGSHADMSELEKTRTHLREKVSEKNSSIQRKIPVQAPSHRKLQASDLKVGASVSIPSLGLTGTVHTLPDRSGKLFVTCGIMNTKVSLNDIRLLSAEESARLKRSEDTGSRKNMKKLFAAGSGAGHKNLDFSRTARVSPEINLLGMTTQEAVSELDKYLDDARMSHLSSVRIIHGKGTGALRNAVQQYLRRQTWISSYRSGEFGEGDAGVTIVEFS